MNGRTKIRSLERIAIFNIEFYGKKNGNNRYFAYNVLTEDSDRAVAVAREIAKREGYIVEGLIISPGNLFEGPVCIDENHLEEILENRSRFIRRRT